jgi:RimJ/RimL family protein N-acetyltransferase
VAAICDQTGEMAGLTQFGIDRHAPSWGHQFVTAVTRQHRGHRLGLLVKVAMLELLVSAEPGLSRIMTGNADGNQHMIAINTELGFRILDEQQTWDLDVAAVLASGGGRPGQ